MKWLNNFTARLRALFQKSKLDAEMDEEMRGHIELRTQANIEAGMNPEEARFAALRQFGASDVIKEDCRDQRGVRWLEQLVQDIRFGVRQLRKQLGFTTVAIFSLALGIGTCIAIFSLVNAILLRSLPVPNPQELRVVQWTAVDASLHSIDGAMHTTGNRTVADSVSSELFENLRKQSASIADVFGFAGLEDIVVRGPMNAVSTDGMIVSDNFFSTLGVQPAHGLLFTPGLQDANAAQQLVLAHEFWERQLASNPAVVGQSLTLNGYPLTVIGVLPPSFTSVRPGESPSFYVVMAPESKFLGRNVSGTEHWWLAMMARLRPTGSDAQLKAAMGPTFAAAAESQMRSPEILIQPGHNGLGYDRQTYGRPLLLMLGAVGLVMLVACANLAGLSLARGVARQHEFAVRAALGAGRGRLIRQSLAESLLLATCGGLLGLLIAVWARTAISRLLAGSAEGLRYDLSFDLRVVGFAIIAALITALLSGLLPAWRAGRVDPLEGLRTRGTVGLRRLRAGRVLVVSQIALSLVLLAGAGLYLRTLANLNKIDAGFNTDNLLVFQVNPATTGQSDAQLTGFYDRVQTSLNSLPGVRGASVMMFPLLSKMGSSGGFGVVGRVINATESWQTSRLVVGENFFQTLGVPIMEGRAFTTADNQNAPKAIVVNETFAKKYFPGENPIGQAITIWRGEWRIVGICRDIKYENIRETIPPTTYFPFRQFPMKYGSYFAVRTSLSPLALAQAVRSSIAAIDSSVPVAHLTTQEQIRLQTISQERLLATLCGGLAAFALLLSCLGLFGLMAFNVTQRRSEIAVRMTVGATARHVALPIVKEAFFLALMGIGLGLPIAFIVTRLIKNQLFEVQSFDPLSMGLAMLALVIVALGAAWLPAWRATRVDPMTALRAE